MQLWHRYGCYQIYGIRYGYQGLAKDSATPMISIVPESLQDIHETGGSFLGSSRGTPPTTEIVDNLVNHGINILFTIGGDGTMKGALAISEEAKRRGERISVIGIPKTIDNDIPFVRRSFGFETAVAYACQAIRAAHTEAIGYENCIGLVRLMGRHSGYIAATATLATGHVNFCLVPEVPFSLEGPTGLLQLLEERLKSRKHAVVVVAEGAGQDFFRTIGETDASGNKKLGNIGTYLQDRISSHFKLIKEPVSIKYIDPTYIVRAAPANPADQLICSRFAQSAVHAAMSGRTGMLVGYWHGRMTHVPLKMLEGRRQSISPSGDLWFNILETTGQPVEIGPLKPLKMESGT
jgi:6-phosphofructokinase 1